MQTGINLLLWTAAADRRHFRVIENIRAWGFDGIELPMFDPAGSPWAEIGRHCDGLDLGRTAVTIASDTTNPVSADADVRRAGLDHLKRCLDACAEGGINILCGPFYAPVGHLVGRGPAADELNWCAEIMRQAADYAVQYSVSLAFEPLNRFETYLCNCMEDGVRMAQTVDHPNFGLLYDTFHAHIEEKDATRAITTAGAYIRHIHISENDRSTPGSGQVAWEDTFKAIRAIGYDGWLTIEAFGRAMPEVAAATCIWRAMFDNEEQLARDGLRHIKAYLEDI